MHSPPMIDRLQ